MLRTGNIVLPNVNMHVSDWLLCLWAASGGDSVGRTLPIVNSTGLAAENQPQGGAP